jgi:hypothetical protein
LASPVRASASRERLRARALDAGSRLVAFDTSLAQGPELQRCLVQPSAEGERAALTTPMEKPADAPLTDDQRTVDLLHAATRAPAPQDMSDVSCRAQGRRAAAGSARRRVNRVLAVRGPALRSSASPPHLGAQAPSGDADHRPGPPSSETTADVNFW